MDVTQTKSPQGGITELLAWDIIAEHIYSVVGEGRVRVSGYRPGPF